MRDVQSSLYFRQPLSFLKSRLSQRIVLAIFVSIVAIEGIILIPSIFRREREFLTALSDQSAAALEVLMAASRDDDIEAAEQPEQMSEQMVLEQLRSLQSLEPVVGGVLYDQDGREVGSFGEAPVRSLSQLQTTPNSAESAPVAFTASLNRSLSRYDIVLPMPLGTDYWLVVSHDVSSVRTKVIAFVWRIVGLVVIISAVVTLSTLIVLRTIVIAPILALSNDLRRAAPAAFKPGTEPRVPFVSTRYQRRRDEIGMAIEAFVQMFEQISQMVGLRQQAEVALRDSENRFRTLVQRAAESILVMDREGAIVDINAFGLQSLQYDAQEIVGKSIFDINPVLTHEAFADHWERLSAGEPRTFESIHRRRDGSDFPVEIRSSLIEKAGKPQLLSLVRDISDRKQAETAQARLAEIGELAAMIVHEVRNPFSTVYMALSAFQTTELSPRSEMRLSLAMEEAERLKRLLNEILMYSKEQTLQLESLELTPFCKSLMDNLQGSTAACDRTITLAAKADATIHADADKLKQVFINLVINACEAAPPHSTVSWQIMNTDTPGTVDICIHNGGEPIPPDILPKLTTPFVSTKADGNGLGLAITKRIVEAHGGTLEIVSTAAAGTRVTVRLRRLG